MALLLTVGSNLLGIFTMPFVLSAVLGAVSGSVKIAPKPLLQSLMKTILVPLLIGASARALIPGAFQAVKLSDSLHSGRLLCILQGCSQLASCNLALDLLAAFCLLAAY